jgi:hypothetical protein
MSGMLGMTVFTPLPLPSTLAMRRGILYLKSASLEQVTFFDGTLTKLPVEGVLHIAIHVESHRWGLKGKSR